MLKTTLTSLFCLAVLAGAAQADPRLLGTHTKWDAFEETKGRAKTCFMVSVPDKKSPGNVNHGTVYLNVAHHLAQKNRDVVSLITGFSFKKETEVTAAIGGKRFKMFVSADSAWSYDSKQDADMVKAMKAGATVFLSGTSARGTSVSYEFSLIGFTAAYNAISKACS